MITRKNSVNSVNNSFRRKRFSINPKNYESWIRKTFIRTIISITLLMMFLVIQVLNFQSPKNALHFIKEKLEYNANINTYIVEIKKMPNYVISLGDKALEAMKITDDIDNRFIPPVDGEVITHFNENIAETSNVSNGLIFSSDAGDNIYSVDDGVVIDIGANKSIGNYIIIKHKGELLSVYKYVGDNIVELNQRVEKGQVIGTSLEKLLLEVWYRNEAIDPIQYIDISMQQL